MKKEQRTPIMSILLFALCFIALDAGVHRKGCFDHDHGANRHSMAPAATIESSLSFSDYQLDFAPSVSSFTPDYTTQIGRMQAYFANSLANEANNSYGSCGYVSFIQYLGYYDSFHNDHLIPYPYEVISNVSYSSWSAAMAISPGVVNQSYPRPSDPETIYNSSTGMWELNPNRYTSLAFYNFVQANKNYDFQMKLIDIVNSERGTDDIDYSCSIGMWNYHYILDSLYGPNVYQYTYYDCASINASSPSDSTWVSYCQSCLNILLPSGIPIILHIAKLNADGSYRGYHSVVAYRKDSLGIHCNFGWSNSSGSSDVILDLSGSDPYYITEFGYIGNFGTSNETHSGNYKIGGLKYCGCGTHAIHSFTSTNISNFRHRNTCGCGYSFTEDHFAYEDEQSTGKCSLCHASRPLLLTRPREYED